MMTERFIHDDGRRVYAVPATLRVECTLFVLAPNLNEATKAISLINLNDMFSFNHDSLTTDGDNLLMINDVMAIPIDTTVVDIRMLDTKDYPPNEHPNFVGIPLK